MPGKKQPQQTEWKNEGEMVEWGNKIRDLTNENKKLRDMLKMSYSKYSMVLKDLKKFQEKLEEEKQHCVSLARIVYKMKYEEEDYVDWDIRINNYDRYLQAIDEQDEVSFQSGSSGISSDAD